MMQKTPLNGHGAIGNTDNPFAQNTYIKSIYDDDLEPFKEELQIVEVFPKSILNKVISTDLPMAYSINPYQGCEHGCAYCYARPTHEFWGYSAGLDFERKIMVKKNAAQLLEQTFSKKNYQADSVLLSGNTDCYQPIEKKLGLTRQLLQVFLKFKHPVQIITKNVLFLKDLDLLTQLNRDKLIFVTLSISTTNEDLRRRMEPRTVSTQKKIKAIEILKANQIPVHVMLSPIIAGLNDSEIMNNMKLLSELSVDSVSYSLVRLNDSVAPIFTEWLNYNYPEKAQRVLNHIKATHSGNLGEKRTSIRMKGEGNIADIIRQQFKLSEKKYFPKNTLPTLDYSHFIKPLEENNQLRLF